MSATLASAMVVLEVRDLHPEVRLGKRIIFMSNMSYGVVPGAREAADGHSFVASAGVVGRSGPGPPP